MCDVRIEPCWQCGGDGGGESRAYGYDPRDGSPLTHWIECRFCNGEGWVIEEVMSCTLEDLDAEDEWRP